jgi:alkanesulfonate monooxygenase SsuD/methylene tetrahydromethanopterin reductase-like flavin-dependent oxidoreductase (luciferase family)
MTRRRIGLGLDPQFLTVAELLERGTIGERSGASSLWLVQLPNQRDSVSMLAALAAHTRTLRLGCGIVPLYTRPPVVMAQTALTLDEVSGGRIELGLGLGHRGVGEWIVGARPRPALASLREYVEVVRELVRDGEVSRTGQHYSGHASYAAPRTGELPLLVGGFGPRTMQLAGEIADGVILWMCTPDYVRDHVVPNLEMGLARRGEPAPDFRVLAIVGGGLSADPEPDRAVYRRSLDLHLRVSTYRTMFERSGHGDSVVASRASDELVDDLFVAGDAKQLRAHLHRYWSAGVDEVLVSPSAAAHDDPELFEETVRCAADAAADAALSGLVGAS